MMMMMRHRRPSRVVRPLSQTTESKVEKLQLTTPTQGLNRHPGQASDALSMQHTQLGTVGQQHVQVMVRDGVARHIEQGEVWESWSERRG